MLNYEVQDVRNVAAGGNKDMSELKDVSNATVGPNRRYQNLQEDNSQMESKM